MDEVRPLQGPSALYSLDEPRAVRPGVRWTWILGFLRHHIRVADDRTLRDTDPVPGRPGHVCGWRDLSPSFPSC